VSLTALRTKPRQLDLRNSLALQNSTVDLEFNGGNFSFGDTTVAQTAYTFGGLTGVAGLT